MTEMLERHAVKILIAACAVLAVAGLFFRADKGVESLPLLYPALGAVSVTLAVVAARLLAPILRIGEGDDDAD